MLYYWLWSQIVLFSDLLNGHGRAQVGGGGAEMFCSCSVRQLEVHVVPVGILDEFWVLCMHLIHNKVGHLGSAGSNGGSDKAFLNEKHTAPNPPKWRWLDWSEWKMIFVFTLVVVYLLWWTNRTLWNFEFSVEFDLEGQGQSTPKTIRILTNLFCIFCPNFVVLAWTDDELLYGHRQMQAKTIPEDQNWPWVKSKWKILWMNCLWGSGGRLNIKMSSYKYRDPHVKDKTVLQPSYL